MAGRARRVGRGSVALLALLVTVFTGCSAGVDPSQDPREAMERAFQATADAADAAGGFEVTLGLDSDVASVRAAFSEPGDPLTTEEARWLIDGSIRLASHIGEPGDTSDDSAVVTVRTGDLTLFALRYLDEAVYVKAEVRQAMKDFGAPPQAFDGLSDFAAGATRFGIPEPDRIVGGAWVELDGVTDLFEALGRFSSPTAPEPIPSEAAIEMYRRMVALLYSGDVSYLGATDRGERVRMIIDGAAMAEFAIDAIELAERAGTVPPNVPDRVVDRMINQLRREIDENGEFARFRLPVDVWIGGGRVSRVGIDLVAVRRLNEDVLPAGALDDRVERLIVAMDIATFDGSGMKPPEDPVTVNVFELFGRFAGQFGGGFGLRQREIAQREIEIEA